ncbi:MAG: cyclic nucleotide-binding domain-containing protein [Deltaproteobacteria bacterium]|nr:cyclic nucleotide-binding domain-containing protein [Deltaproteobacteria bacterium]
MAKPLPQVDKPKGKAAKAKAGGWAAFTDGGAAPAWATAARVVMVLALAATIPTVLGVAHGNRLVWTIAIAALPFFWMAFGYHVWRRICPLAVAGQVGRLVGRPGQRRMGDWMARNYILVQLGLMTLALTLRLVATNGSDVWLAGFLGAVVAAAIATSFVYGGKTWCNFLCPVGLVEKIHTEPSRSAANVGEATSQCAPCVACKKHCPDIDLEQGYWKEAAERARRVAYFAWPGIVVAFYTYYFLVDGRWSDYFDGRWAYDRALPSRMFDDGFYFAPVPRLVAAPLTLVAFGAASFALFAAIERVLVGRRLRRLPPGSSGEAKQAERVRVRHALLAVCGLVAFNAFYLFAGQPSLRLLPAWVVTAWGLVVVFASTAIFARRVTRSEDKYVQEKFAQKILKKWEWGDAPPSDELKDIYLLHTERTKQREARLRAYKETVREMVADGTVTRAELVILDSLRAQLGITDKDHQKIVGELSAEERQLFDPEYRGSVEQRLKGEQYRKDLERLVVEAARAGASPSPSTLAALRAERGVSEEEEASELASILAPGGPIAAIYDGALAEVARLVAAAEAVHQVSPVGTDSASLAIVRHLARRRAHETAIHALGVLAVMTKRPEVEMVRVNAEARGSVRVAQLDMLSGVQASLRVPLVEVLQRLERGGTAELASAPILAIARDPSRHLRAAGAMLLSRFDDDAARDGLLAFLDDPEPIVREAAVRAMGAKSRLTRDLLAKVLGDRDPTVRHAAVRAVSGGTTAPEMPALDPSMLAQTTRGVGKPGVYATLDANAAMASLTTIEKMMLIRQVPIFAELSADDLEELAGVVEERRIDPGRDVFKEGDPGDAVYLIVKGAVSVFTGGAGTDRPERLLNELSAGACIGEMAVLDASPRSATVRAIDRTRTLRVPGEGFKRVMSERPEMSQAIVAELVKRMRGMMAQAPAPVVSGAAIRLPAEPDK